MTLNQLITKEELIEAGFKEGNVYSNLPIYTKKEILNLYDSLEDGILKLRVSYNTKTKRLIR